MIQLGIVYCFQPLHLFSLLHTGTVSYTVSDFHYLDSWDTHKPFILRYISQFVLQQVSLRFRSRISARYSICRSCAHSLRLSYQECGVQLQNHFSFADIYLNSLMKMISYKLLHSEVFLFPLSYFL